MSDLKEVKAYYRILGLQEGATFEEIRRAYRKLARESYPDTHPDDPDAAARFTKISIAYEKLTNRNNSAAPQADDGAKPKNSGFKSAFARATAGMQAAQKLHHAVTQGYRHEMLDLLVNNTRPLDKTIKYILDRNAWDLMEIFVDSGYKPKQSTVDIVSDIAWRTHDMTMLYEMLNAPGVMPDERTFLHMIDTGRSRLVERFLSEGLIKATPEMVDRAVHNYFEKKPDVRDNSKRIIRALTEAGAIPERTTIRYAKRASYTDFLSDELAAARQINKEQAAAAKPRRFHFRPKASTRPGSM